MLVFGVGINGSRVEIRMRAVWRGRSGCHDSIYRTLLVQSIHIWKGEKYPVSTGLKATTYRHRGGQAMQAI